MILFFFILKDKIFFFEIFSLILTNFLYTLYNICTMYIYCIFSIPYTINIQCIYIVFSLYPIQYMYNVHILYFLYTLYNIYTMYIYCIFSIPYTIYVQCTCILQTFQGTKNAIRRMKDENMRCSRHDSLAQS